MADNMLGMDDYFGYFDHSLDAGGARWLDLGADNERLPGDVLVVRCGRRTDGGRLPALGPRHLLGAVHLGR